MDDLFLCTMGSLILLMQAGFAFVEAGSVRAKNTISILIKNFADLCFGGLAYWSIGYALAFGKGSSLIGFTYFAGFDLPSHKYSHLFFQSTFAATCATIVSGAIAERCHFNGYIIFSAVVTGIIYPIPTHWCWAEEGWLRLRGFHDFAGSGVVHMSGGVVALVGTFILGPRIDRFKMRLPSLRSSEPAEGNEFKESKAISGHSMPLVSLGGFILVTGFMAFNGGSRGSISQPEDGEKVGRAILSTLLACSSSGISVLLIYKFVQGQAWSLSRVINGCVSGMVCISGGCDQYSLVTSLFIGCLSGPLYLLASSLMLRCRIDDPVDAVAVHLASGTLGLILPPFFNGQEGPFFSNLGANLLGLVTLLSYYLVASVALFVALDRIQLFRVDPKDEITGLDEVKHKEKAYEFGELLVNGNGTRATSSQGRHRRRKLSKAEIANAAANFVSL